MSKVLLAVFTISCLSPLRNIVAAQDNVPPKELVQYVRDAKKAGLTEKQIQQNAVTAGWAAAIVSDAIASASTDPKSQPGEIPGKKPATDSAIPAAGKSPEGTTTTTSQPGYTPAQGPTPAGQTADVTRPIDDRPAPPAIFSASPGVQAVTSARQPAHMLTAGEGTPRNGISPAPAGKVTGESGPALPGVSDSAVKQSQPVAHGVPDDYEIGAGDVLHVNVWGEPTASVNGTVVRTDGKISLPLIHDIKVIGLTPAQAEKGIAEQLGRFLNNPDVAVIIGGINSKKIYVTGQVKKEGTIPFTYRMTVMQAISEAGGLTPYAKRKKIYVLRSEDGRSFNLPFDYDAVLQGKRMEMNIPLKPGDQLIVP
jgi:polysaccharide export outer membrane protein